MMDKVRVLVVDDHDLFRDGVASLLAARGYMVAGEAANGEAAVARALDLRPDLVLMDIRMPVMGGLEATRRIKAALPETKVVILTVSDDEEDLFEAIKSGAQGYLLKNLKSDVFFDMVAGVMRGEAPMSPGIATKMLQEFSRMAASTGTKEGSAGAGDLTDRETEVLKLVAQGKGNKEIAAQLAMSESTVKYHLRNILDRLHLENRAQVIAYATRLKMGEQARQTDR